MEVTEDFGEGEIVWSDGIGKGYVYRVRIVDAKGTLALCGAGAFTDPSSRMQSRQALQRARLMLNGKPILKDLTFFTRVKRERDIMGATATCKLTSAKTPKSGKAEFGIDFGRKGYRF